MFLKNFIFLQSKIIETFKPGLAQVAETLILSKIY